MRVCIVHAHHEPTSYNAAMTARAVEALTAAGHEVAVSDLYAIGFDPVSDRRNFVTCADDKKLHQQAEEAHASANNGFHPDLQAEMDKLAWCDVLIFQFPIWWLGLPAILKGWVDKVFAIGRAYGGGRYFEGGMFKGKRAMCSLTVGGWSEVYSRGGVYGAIEDILYPIHRGIFSFTGPTVIEPFVIYGPSRLSEEERQEGLARYQERVLTLDVAPIIAGPTRTQYEKLIRGPAE